MKVLTYFRTNHLLNVINAIYKNDIFETWYLSSEPEQ